MGETGSLGQAPGALLYARAPRTQMTQTTLHQNNSEPLLVPALEVGSPRPSLPQFTPGDTEPSGTLSLLLLPLLLESFRLVG